MNLPIAAAASSHAAIVERLRLIPTEFWWKAALALVIIIAAVIVMRKVAKMNRLMLCFGLFLAGTMIGVNWIYERNEPTWATPVVQVLSNFFPTKTRVHI